jgi:uncharacterized membrane protein YgdD (TMEM256/DUF423 family)
MLVALVLGALGTHVVAGRVTPGQLASYETAVLYQSLHALGLVLLGLVERCTGTTSWLRWAAGFMVAGVVLFAGPIYLATAGASHAVLGLAPAGGMALMLSWLLLAAHAAVARHSRGGT